MTTSSIVVPTLAHLSNYPPEIAKALVDVATAAVADINTLELGDLTSSAPQGVGTANAVGTATSAARADHVHAHGSQTVTTLHAVATPSAAGFESAADKTKLDSIQTGTVTLSSGTFTKNTGITITAGSKVGCFLNTPGGTLGIQLAVPDAGYVVGGPGTGAFTVNSVAAAGTTVTTDTSTVNYVIVG